MHICTVASCVISDTAFMNFEKCNTILTQLCIDCLFVPVCVCVRARKRARRYTNACDRKTVLLLQIWQYLSIRRGII